MKKIILHAGTYKTGTTTLQNYLTHNRKQLDKKGIYYPEPAIFPLRAAQHDFAAWADGFKEEFSALSFFNVTDSQQKNEFDARIKQYYQKILENTLSQDKSLLLSSEFIFDLGKDRIEKIKNFLSKDPREINIVIYLRRADLLLISAYKHHILTGIIKENEPVFNHNDPLMKFRKKLEEFVDVFGKKSIIVKVYDKNRFINSDLIDDFLSLLGIDNFGLERVPSANEALSSIELRVLLECAKHINPFIRKDNKELWNPVWQKLTQRVMALGLGGGKDMLVSRNKAYSFYEKYKDDYRWVKDTFLPESRFPTLFDEDFSMYNEKYSPVQLSFDQGAGIMLKLWENEYDSKPEIKEKKKSAKQKVVDNLQKKNNKKGDISPKSQADSGQEKLIVSSGLFDPVWYVSQYPDVKKACADPLQHYCEFGWIEGRNPSPLFNTKYYLHTNPDVNAGKINPLVHYIQFGKSEGRKPIPQMDDNEYISIIRESGFFDHDWYLQQYPDVKNSGTDPAVHFCSFGWKEGRDPSPGFSVEKYLYHYPEAGESGLNPLVYYHLQGMGKGHVVFDLFAEMDEVLPAITCSRNIEYGESTDILLAFRIGSEKELNLLAETVNSVLDNTKEKYRLFLIDDASGFRKTKTYLQTLKNSNPEIEIKINKKPLGFAGSINRYLGNSNNHVVLLRNGVKVPKGWTGRLLYPILSNPDISSVSSMMNEGSLCGFPVNSETNSSVFDLDVESIDKAFRPFSGYFIDAPAGNSSCISLNRKALDAVGFPDEKIKANDEYGCITDWCRRAKDKNFKNVITPGLFLYQEKIKSVIREKTKGEDTQRQEDPDNRHLEYKKDVCRFIQKDRLMQFRFFSFLQMCCMNSGKGLCLLFEHNTDSGSNNWSQKFVSVQRRLQPVCVVQYHKATGNFIIHPQFFDTEFIFEINDIGVFIRIIQELPLAEILLSNLRGYPHLAELLESVLELRQKTNSALNVVMHDYTPVCPNSVLLDGQGRICFPGPYKNSCENCRIPYDDTVAGKVIKAWRNVWEKVLGAAGAIRVFSDVTIPFLQQAYPHLDVGTVLVKPPETYRFRKARLVKGGKPHIGIIGNISPHKGSGILNPLNEFLKTNNCGKISIVGTVNDQEIAGDKLQISGPYWHDRLPEIIEQRGINVCFFPSIWPETFSYIVEEIISMQIPLLVYDTGAPAERVRNYPKGKIIPLDSDADLIFGEARELWQQIPTDADVPPDDDFRHYSPGDFHEQRQKFDFGLMDNKVKLIAYHLPQFYTFPENDEWWGKGFTEWTNVKKALPLFEGHYQPRQPHKDIGYYRLDRIKHLRKQAELCNEYGIHGFCFYHYWFGGKRLMEKSVDLLLENKDINLNFCLCWANEGWTRSWDGNEKNVLIAQNYNPANDIRFIEDLVPYLKDPRYIRIDGKPVIKVYRIDHIPFVKRTVDNWRKWCVNNGIGEIYLVGTAIRGIDSPADYGFDALVDRPFFFWNMGQIIERKNELNTGKDHSGIVYYHKDVADFFINQEVTQEKGRMLRSVGVMWDPSARHGDRCLLMHKTTPDDYERWLSNHIEYTEKNIPESERIIFLNAWNEWAEGAYLEPDRKFGYAMLNATARAMLTGVSREEKKEFILENIFLEIEHSEIFADYQKRDLKSIFTIISKYYDNPEDLTILDIGCSCSEVSFISQYVKKITGINISFRDSDKEKYFGKILNAEFHEMSGTELKFRDKTFDFVYSLNVFEHINDLSRSLDEQIRVTKNTGLIYSFWGPVWSGSRGHHIHDIMVRNWEKACNAERTPYVNNDMFITEWAHLLLSENEMSDVLVAKLKNRDLVKRITDYIYHSDIINRLFYDDIEAIFAKKKIYTVFWKNINSKDSVPENILEKLRRKYKRENYNVLHCEVLFTKEMNPSLSDIIMSHKE